MTVRRMLSRIVLQEDLNFLLTNRVPRQLLTRFMGWFSQIEQPLVRDLSIATWKLFADLDLSDARKTKFRSLHDCFTRELKPGARTVNNDPTILTSPSDGIVGACGQIAGVELFQAKGFPYTLLDLLGDPALVERYRDGSYITLRLTSSMYHRFHAPADCDVHKVTYISGDTWNVNPIALKRVEKLFCKNERALIETTLTPGGQRILLVPVAAILVASIRLHFINVLLHIRYRGPNVIPCAAHFEKGQEMGWFQHGSTIIVFAPKGFALCDGITDGKQVRMGEALMRLPRG
ncbi:MAG: archaetidylserine decarboxylase [Candidatus Accumulibacter necessarius]|uniref:archaetidylserine decarboxylase n=1 Tax=Candidatus Accumulibacter necessarius TaxID=2954386 RepID=UPI002FC3D4B3